VAEGSNAFNDDASFDLYIVKVQAATLVNEEASSGWEYEGAVCQV
jgi:hypothetical protein